MIRLLTAVLLLSVFMQAAITRMAFAQIEMELDDIVVVDPALCEIAEFMPPEPIPTICQKHAELGQNRGFLRDFGRWCVISMEGRSEAAIREACQRPISE